MNYRSLGNGINGAVECIDTLANILALTLGTSVTQTTVPVGSKARPTDVAGCTLEMGADGLWTGASVGTLTQVQADALVASGAMATVKAGTPGNVAGTLVCYGGVGVGWVRASDIGPGSPSTPFTTTAERNAAYAMDLPAPHAVVWAADVPYEWIGTTTANTDADWVALDSPAITLLAPDKIRNDVVVYDIQNTRYARETLSHIYVEGLVPPDAADYDTRKQITLDGLRKYPIKRNAENTQNIQTTSVAIPVKAGRKTIKTSNVSIVTTKATALVSTVFRPLFIGDSISASEFTGIDGDLKTSWGLPSMVKEFWQRDKVDGLGGACVLTGHIGNAAGRSIDYRGANYPLRAFHEARGGWCAATWASHPILLTASPGASSATAANALASWDLCNFTTSQGRAYSGSTADKELIRDAKPTFAPGAYNYSAHVWDYLRTRPGWTGTQDAWVDNGTNRGFIDTMMASIVVTPDNPFWSSAQAGAGWNPYSFTGRYKTLATDGTTRLVPGSTAGSLITAGNINDIDVVDAPTHFIIELGENDRWFFPSNLAKTVATLETFNSRLNTVYAWLGAGKPKIAYIFPRNTGCYNRAANPDVPVMEMNATSAQWKYDLAREMKALGYTVIDAATQDPSSSANWNQQKYNMLDDGSIESFGGFDGTHPGMVGLRGLAYQIYAWMYQSVATP